jgi:hypothetical protein
MLLLSLRHRPGAQMTICPLLWAGAALPAPGLLALPFVGWKAWQTGSGILWAFLIISGFFMAIFAYAFYRAALSQQVRCRRQDSRLLVYAHEREVEADAAAVLLTLVKSTVGVRNPITVHDVTLRAPGCWDTSFLLHRGLTSSGALRAAQRLRAHLGVRLAAAEVVP